MQFFFFFFFNFFFTHKNWISVLPPSVHQQRESAIDSARPWRRRTWAPSAVAAALLRPLQHTWARRRRRHRRKRRRRCRRWPNAGRRWWQTSLHQLRLGSDDLRPNPAFSDLKNKNSWSGTATAAAVALDPVEDVPEEVDGVAANEEPNVGKLRK